MNRETEYNRIVDSFKVLNVPKDIQFDIMEALCSDKWDWFKDCDGCTGVTEVYWPSKYFPPCVRHDFDCRIGTNGVESSTRFFNIQRAYGMSKLRAGVRSVGVFIYWYTILKWKRGK